MDWEQSMDEWLRSTALKQQLHYNTVTYSTTEDVVWIVNSFYLQSHTRESGQVPVTLYNIMFNKYSKWRSVLFRDIGNWSLLPPSKYKKIHLWRTTSDNLWLACSYHHVCSTSVEYQSAFSSVMLLVSSYMHLTCCASQAISKHGLHFTLHLRRQRYYYF
jgi:hypothetical protein